MILSFALFSALYFGLLPLEDIFIVDGTKAKLGQIPYQVSLQINGAHICGGVLIDASTVLSAAHCFDKYEPTDFKAVAGVVNLQNGLGATGQESDVNHAVINSEYNSITYASDIALIKLEKAFQLSPFIQSVLLPQSESVPSGYAIVSGWGKTAENSPLSKWLLDTQLIVMTEEQCQHIYGEDITSAVFCAKSQPGGNQDSCQGDSGGPVTCVENGQAVLCGLVSVGIGCGREDTPGVYTSISYYKQWIQTTP